MNTTERIRRYVAAIPGAISGQNGHDQTFSVASALVHGFDLDDSTALSFLSEYTSDATRDGRNQRCGTK